MRPIALRVANRFVLILAVLLWAGAIGMGMKRILDHQEKAGDPASAPALWPESSRVRRSIDRLTLVAFAHPRCSCTRATLDELSRLLARTPGRLSAQLVFAVPAGLSIDWTRSELYRSAQAIPGLGVHLDSSAVEARRFGVSTSGQVLVYDPAGRLLFAGGITPGRAHEGDNAGREAIERLAARQPAEWGTTPVFGCALQSPAASSPRKRRNV